MTKLVLILNFEEGYKEKVYHDTEGYPTIAGGIKIGPKGAALSNYTFTVPRVVGDVWKQYMIDTKTAEMKKRPDIAKALLKCNDARADILYSMAYQMGVAGLDYFKTTLRLIAEEQYAKAGEAMLNSLWAKQTPERAKRHAEVMKTGTYDAYKGLI